MNKDKDLIHKLLDGEASPEEKMKILNHIDSDPILKEEFYLLKKAVDVLENCERKTVPASFAFEVMRRLPVYEKEKVEDKGIKGFFFKGRVLRWNMAVATAALVFIVILLGGILQLQKRHMVISSTDSKGSAISVKFNFYAPEAKMVSIAGDFNRWSIEEGRMMKQDNGVWTIEVPLKPGTHHYMFVVDGKTWVPDPNAELYRDDGFGNKNSVLRVSTL